MPLKQKAMLDWVLSRVIETVYPPRCMNCAAETTQHLGLCGACWGQMHFFSGPVCDLCGTSVPVSGAPPGRLICRSCERHPPAWDQGRAAVAYEGAGRQIAMALKHADRTELAAPLARWMTAAGADILDPQMLVLPVPIHWSRRLRRRYNQAELLAEKVAARISATYRPDALRRRHATATLDGLSRQARHETLSGALFIPMQYVPIVTDRHVLLVDDVLTTGATLSAATEVCRAAGARRVSVLTLARVAWVE